MKIVVGSVLCIMACNEIHAFMSYPLRVNTMPYTLRQTQLNNVLSANRRLKLMATDDKKGDLPSNDLPVDSEPYDGGSGGKFYEPYERDKSPEVVDQNFLKGRSLFDLETRGQRRPTMDPIRQSEVRPHYEIDTCFRTACPDYDYVLCALQWNAVNLFSQEKGNAPLVLYSNWKNIPTPRTNPPQYPKARRRACAARLPPPRRPPHSPHPRHGAPGFLLAIAGVLLLALVCGSVFASGGIDSSARFSQSALDAQGCVLESDPRCRY
jgi:hypothetical protein